MENKPKLNVSNAKSGSLLHFHEWVTAVLPTNARHPVSDFYSNRTNKNYNIHFKLTDVEEARVFKVCTEV